MECIHCKHQEADGAQECSRCGFNFAKWKGGAASRAPAPKAEGGFHPFLIVFALTAAGAAWYLHGLGKDTGASARPAAPASAPAAAAPARDAWRFEGQVSDLLRGSPIKGVRVAFTDLSTGQMTETSTDDQGRYSLDVAIRWKLGYAAEITHPLYVARYWSGSVLAQGRTERLKLRLEPPEGSDSRAYRGSAAGRAPAPLDFAVFPQYLTDEEKREAGL